MKVQIDADLQELIPGFLNNRQKDIEKLEAMLARDDIEAIQQVGHTMKGNGAGYGFERISQLGISIENAAKSNQIEQLRALIKELGEFLDQVEIEFV